MGELKEVSNLRESEEEEEEEVTKVEKDNEEEHYMTKPVLEPEVILEN